MGNYTNKYFYPEWICNLLKHNPYTRGHKKSDISVTQLIDSPQVLQLRKAHRDDIEEDVSDRIWAIYGSAVHAIAETANTSSSDILTEKRYHHKYGDHIVTGQYDIYDMKTKIIYDFKTVSSWSLIRGPKEAWVNQLNVLADLLRKNGWEVKGLSIAALGRNWDEKISLTNKSYPDRALMMYDIEMWPEDVTEVYINKRLQAHFFNDPICTLDEKWASEEKWAVMKEGRSRAVKLFVSRDEANDFLIIQKDQDKLKIEHRPGYDMRCARYCNVQPFCPQYAKENQA